MQEAVPSNIEKRLRALIVLLNSEWMICFRLILLAIVVKLGGAMSEWQSDNFALNPPPNIMIS